MVNERVFSMPYTRDEVAWAARTKGRHEKQQERRRWRSVGESVGEERERSRALGAGG